MIKKETSDYFTYIFSPLFGTSHLQNQMFGLNSTNNSTEKAAFYESWFDIIIFILFVADCLVISIHIAAIRYSRKHFYQKKRQLSDAEKKDLPGISILKPLVGIDENTEINLNSFFTVDYPRYELLFCVASSDDPVIPLVQSLIAKYPRVDSKLFVGASRIGVNNKINNMYRAYNSAKNDIIMIADSGIYMQSDSLIDMVLTMLSKPKIGIVHQAPYILPLTKEAKDNLTDEGKKCHLMQQIFFGTWHSKHYLTASWLGVPCITGMSCLMRKDALDKGGGLKAFSNYLAEDHFMAKYLKSVGLDHRLCTQPAWQNPPPLEIKAFRERLTRWTQLRTKMIPLVTLLEPFSECFLNILIIILFGMYLFPNHFTHPFLVFIGHITVWFIADYTLFINMYPPSVPRDFTFMEYSRMWLYRELTTFYYSLKSQFKPTIEWRGRHYKLYWGGLAEELPLCCQNGSLHEKSN